MRDTHTLEKEEKSYSLGVFAAKNRELQRSSDNQLNGKSLHLLGPTVGFACISIR